MKRTWPLLSLIAVGLVGCEVEIDPNAFFPQDYETSMTKVGGCRTSQTHSDPYYTFHVSASGVEAFNAGMDVPVGTVLLKAQYKDAECADLDRWTVMKKREVGFDPDNYDWEWQSVDGEGQVAEQGKLSYCKSCHKPCPNGICTPK